MSENYSELELIERRLSDINETLQLILEQMKTNSTPNSQETKLADMETLVEVKDTPAHEKTNSRPDTNIQSKHKAEIDKDYDINEIREKIVTCKDYSNKNKSRLIDPKELLDKFVKEDRSVTNGN